MKMRNYLFKTQKTIASDIDPITSLMIKGAFIKQQVAGVFQFTNLGLRLLNNIEKIIRKHIDTIAQEVRIPILQDKDTWKETGRDIAYAETMFSFKDRKEREFCLAPTSEEYCVKLVENFIESYKQLPITVYQIGEKYRDELRCRFGLVRSKQFIMKDAYSFAANEKQATEIYVNFYNLYCNIFKELGLDVITSQSDPGEIGGNFAHEFLVESSLGEEKVKNCRKANPIENIEQLKDNECEEKQAMEIGEIFYLDKKYSSVLKAGFMNEEKVKQNFIMGCYGIGVSRILAVLFEKHKFFPKHFAPFKIYIVSIEEKKANLLYKNFKQVSLLDNRDKSFGEKMTDAELIRSPIRVVVGKSFEIEDFSSRSKAIVDSLEEAIKILNQILNE